MKIYTFATRCAKEIIRDPINVSFGIGFPIVLLLLLSAIQAKVAVSLFEIDSLTPAITIFGLSFITLFSSTLIAKDRESSLLQRLYTTPLKPFDFIAGYMLPLIPIAIAQCILCYIVALILGLKISINILYAVLMILPTIVFYISLGLLCGSIFNVKQVGGICGALLTNLSAWLSGTWFEIELIGGTFLKTAKLLPFYHAVQLERAIISGEFTKAYPHLLIVVIYAIITTALAVFIFFKQMKKQ